MNVPAARSEWVALSRWMTHARIATGAIRLARERVRHSLPLALWTSLVLGASVPGVSRADALVAITTDFSTGSLSSLSLTPPFGATPDVAELCPDAVARSYGGLLYVVNRDCGNIQVLDPGAGFGLVREFSVGAASNPQDICFVSATRAYVTRYEDEWLLEVNPSTGTIVDWISLAAFADADGIPEMHRMFLQGEELYVQIQRLNRLDGSYAPVAPSWLAVVDVSTNEVVDVRGDLAGTQGVQLTTTNPNGPMTLDLGSGHLLVPTSGSFFGPADGGIERVNLWSKSSTGLAVTEATLGGNLSRFTQWSARRAYAVVSDASFVTHLVAFDPATGASLGTVASSSGFNFYDCVTMAAGSYLYLADRDFIDPGVRVYNAATGAFVTGPIPTGLPPSELHVWRPATSGVDEVAGGGLFDEGPYPNPTSRSVSFGWALPAAGSRPTGTTLEVRVFDTAGALVRRLPDAATFWDGRDDAGRRIPAGRYLLRARDGHGREDVRSMVVVR